MEGFDELPQHCDVNLRYVLPKSTRFFAHGGPYRKVHLYDTIRCRDVIYCEQHQWMVERDRAMGRDNSGDFLLAAYGCFQHPNTLSTLDVGVNSQSGLLFFTTPLPPPTLQSVFSSIFRNAERLEIFERLFRLGEYWISRDLMEATYAGVLKSIAADVEAGWISEWRRSPTISARTLRVLSDDLKRRTQVNLEIRLANEERDSEKINEEPERWQIRRISLCRAALDELFREFLKLNPELERLSFSERLILPNLRKFAKVIHIATTPVAFAHLREFGHFELSEHSVLCGDQEGEVYVTGWERQANFGTENHPASGREYGLVFNRIAEANRDYLSNRDEKVAPDGPAIDVYGLGSTLSFLVHETPSGRDRYSQDAEQLVLQTIYMSRESPLQREAAGLAARLGTVCHKAMQYYPQNRYLNVAEFAEAVSEALTAS